MNNFTSRVNQPWTTYDNRLIQGETIFKNSSQKLCYLYLVSYSNASKIFPSIDTIADAICCKRRATIMVIQQLEELGLTEVIRTPGKSNQYILNDYFEVEQQTSAKNAPVQKMHQSSAKNAPLPVQKMHPITKTIKLKTKNKISSSSDTRNPIDSVLKNKYPNANFDEVKEQLLQDGQNGSITIETDKQYKSSLEYRLKHYKPTTVVKTSRNRRSIRTEVIPAYFDRENNITMDPEEVEAKQASIAEKLKQFRS
jgi:hypothetical protein